MPKTRAADANHGVMTDHSIPRQPRLSTPPTGGDLVAFLGSSDDRSLGLAYAELGDKRALQFLRHSQLSAQASDWSVRLRLAALESDPARAIPLYESVLREKPGEVAALVNLGALLGSAGRLSEATRLWRRALESNAGIEEAALNLSQILPVAEGLSVLRKYLEVNPASPAVRSRLAQLQKKIPQ